MTTLSLLGWGFVGFGSLTIFFAALHHALKRDMAGLTASAVTSAVITIVCGIGYLLGNLPESPRCVAPVGSRVTWVDRYDSNRFAYVDTGNKTYCKVYEPRLYYMGVGFVLDQPYEGVPVDRP